MTVLALVLFAGSAICGIYALASHFFGSRVALNGAAAETEAEEKASLIGIVGLAHANLATAKALGRVRTVSLPDPDRDVYRECAKAHRFDPLADKAAS